MLDITTIDTHPNDTAVVGPTAAIRRSRISDLAGIDTWRVEVSMSDLRVDIDGLLDPDNAGFLFVSEFAVVTETLDDDCDPDPLKLDSVVLERHYDAEDDEHYLRAHIYTEGLNSVSDDSEFVPALVVLNQQEADRGWTLINEVSLLHP